MNFRERYNARHHLYATVPKGETLTDQSQRDDTDLNVIFKRHVPGAPIPGTTKTPLFGQDLTNIPTDLASAIESVRRLERLRGGLPEQFRELAVDELLALTPERIKEILTPAKKEETPPPPKENA